jgi:hypothetical protein
MKTKAQSPYGQTATTARELTGVECWNFISRDTFTLPAGTRLRIDNPSDATKTVVCVVDECGEAVGLRLTYTPTRFPHILAIDGPVHQTGYRFIVCNGALAEATGLPIPTRTFDLVGELIAYETGKASTKRVRRLFGRLRETGIGSRLQGHYSSRMANL